MYPANQRIAPTLIITSGIGMLLWGFIPGAVHFLASVDFGAMPAGAPIKFPIRLFILLWLFGGLIGLLGQGTAILGAYLRKQALILFVPMIFGVILGCLQGIAFGTIFSGLAGAGVPLRSWEVRILFGGFCGFVAVPPIMLISIWIRKRMPV